MKQICHIDMSKGNPNIQTRVKEVWDKYLAYHIFNVSEENLEDTYEKLAESLGNIRLCPTANGGPLVKSRDIKVDKDLYKYFASNTKQPLHTDYAYYPEKESPDWLMLYCKSPSEYGGKTHLLSSKSLIKILKKYNPKLLKEIHLDVNWVYLQESGDKIHSRPILNGNKINWNYFQIKDELNTKEVIKVREDFFQFLEKNIVDGAMYDFSKIWKSGDCIIFNDKFIMHGRDAFLGERWLKDHAFYSKKEK